MASERELTKEGNALVAPRSEERPERDLDPRALPSTQLVGETAREAIALIKAQVDLAKVELKEDLQAEVAAAKGLSVAAVAALSGLNLLLVAGAFGLAAVMPAWGALLIVAAVVLLLGAIAARVGFKKIRVPLRRTRKTLEEDVRWVKERTA
jgi:uncharacterized membrane protein YqjE